MPLRVKSTIWAIVIAASAALTAVPLLADETDHDSVRRAVERGEIRPLTEIINVVRGKLAGEVAGVEIERKNGRWLYEFRVVDDKGRLFEVYVDARTGGIERIKEK